MKERMMASSLRKRLETVIPQKRFVHTLGVEKEAVKFAKQFGVDEEKAAIAGLLHDVTKMKSNEEQLDIMQKYHVATTALEQISPKLYHGMTGAVVAKEEYGILDEDILNAIRYHTTARAGMSLLEKIIYMADFTEENRDYEGVEEIRTITYHNFEEGFLYALTYSVLEIVKKGALLHPQTVAARNEALMEKGG